MLHELASVSRARVTFGLNQFDTLELVENMSLKFYVIAIVTCFATVRKLICSFYFLN